MKLLLAFLLSLTAYAGSPQAPFVFTNATVGTSNVVAVAANGSRGYLLVQNMTVGSTAVCYVAFGSVATSSNGVQLTGQQYYEPLTAPKSSINVLCDTANQKIQIVEANW